VEGHLPLDPDFDYPGSTAGERQGPPEDCGGPLGYQELLEAIADRQHPRDRELQENLWEGFDSGEFAPEEMNETLAP